MDLSNFVSETMCIALQCTLDFFINKLQKIVRLQQVLRIGVEEGIRCLAFFGANCGIFCAVELA